MVISTVCFNKSSFVSIWDGTVYLQISGVSFRNIFRLDCVFSDLDINDGPFTQSGCVKVRRSLKQGKRRRWCEEYWELFLPATIFLKSRNVVSCHKCSVVLTIKSQSVRLKTTRKLYNDSDATRHHGSRDSLIR